jgi:hypothetical protein
LNLGNEFSILTKCFSTIEVSEVTEVLNKNEGISIHGLDLMRMKRVRGRPRDSGISNTTTNHAVWW